MAILTKPQLLEKIVQSVHECGWSVLYISTNHPFKIVVYRGQESYRVKIYVWNVSHGGFSRDQAEYRIQLKVREELQPEAGWKTLILGWWDEDSVFTGFDFNKHIGMPGYSSSLQIKEDALRNASLNGLSAYLKENDEIAIAFRTDFFIDYVMNLEKLHAFSESERDLEVLTEVAESIDEERLATDEITAQVSPARQAVVLTVNRKLRDNSFRRRVLTAYHYQCAFCSLQLDLVDAAHIVPVSDECSTDETANGVALCALHHRAYDACYITFDEQYRVVHSDAKMHRLREIGHDGGSEKFLRDLRRMIHLPPSAGDRLRREYISIANELRGWLGLGEPGDSGPR